MSSSALLLLLGLPPLLLESSSAPTVTVSTVSTGTMALGFQERGELTAVVDIAGNRSLLLDSVRHTLLGIVLANQTAVTAPSAVSFDSASGLLRAQFGATPTVYLTVSLRSAGGFIALRIIELDSQPGQVVDVMLAHIPVQLPSVAPGLIAAFDDAFALVVLPTDARTRPLASAPVGSSDNIAFPPPSWGQSCNSTRTGVSLNALCYGATGDLVGRGAVIWGGPRAALQAAIQRAEAAFGLPSPTIDGQWAKTSPMSLSGYLMLATGPDAASINRTIGYTSASGMQYLMYFASFWATAAGPVSWGGHYNVSASWGGLPGLTEKVQHIKAAGLKAGMHTMAGTIDPTDPYVTPVPDPRLAKVRAGTLKSAVGLTETTLLLERAPNNLPGMSLLARTTKLRYLCAFEC
jgi:hypothetical protein